MKKKVRLYRKIDADLITLYEHPQFSLQKAMLVSLRMWSNGECKKIVLPDPYIIYELPKQIEFTLNIPDGDEKTIDFLNKIPLGKRNDALKNMIRSFLAGPVTYAYMNCKIDNKPIIDKYNEMSNAEIICFKKEREAKKELHQRIKNGKKENKKSSNDDFMKKNSTTESKFINSDMDKKMVIRQVRDDEIIEEYKTEEQNTLSKDTVSKNASKIIYENIAGKDKSNELDSFEDDFDLFGAVNNMMSSL